VSDTPLPPLDFSDDESTAVHRRKVYHTLSFLVAQHRERRATERAILWVLRIGFPAILAVAGWMLLQMYGLSGDFRALAQRVDDLAHIVEAKTR